MPKLRPVGVDFVDTAEVVLTTDVDLPASTHEVWEVLVDNESWVHWLTGCRSMSASPTVWSAAGDTRVVGLGPMKIHEIAVSIEPAQRWAMCLTNTTLPLAKAMLEMVELTDTSRNGETRTEVRWTAALDRHPLARPLAPIIESRVTELWGRSLEALYDEVIARR